MPSKAQRDRERQRQSENPPDLPLPSPAFVTEPEEEEMDSVFADFPQNETCIELFRVKPQGGHPSFLEQLSPSMFSFAYVTENYGGGRFLAKGKYKDGSKIKMPFEIEGEPILVKRKTGQGVFPAQSQQVFTPVPVAYDRDNEGGTGQDFQTMMMSMMKTIVQQMQGSEMQMLEKMAKYKELFGAPAQKDAPLEQALNMFQKGVELAGNAGGGDGSFPWMMIIKEMKEPLLKIVDTIQSVVTQPKRVAMGNRPAPGVAAVGGFPPVAEKVEAVTASEPEGEPDMIMMFLKSILPPLINGATRNSDPVTYVDFVLDQVPAFKYDSLREWLIAPDCLDKLAAIEPGIRFQQEWWVSLRAGLLSALDEELGDAVRSVQPKPDSKPSTGSSTDNPIVS